MHGYDHNTAPTSELTHAGAGRASPFEHVDSIDDVLGVLRDSQSSSSPDHREPPVVSPRPDEPEPPELGFISRRGTLARVATSPAADLHALIGGFRSRSDATILTALRGARDLGERH